jgi:hypothetical protein
LTSIFKLVQLSLMMAKGDNERNSNAISEARDRNVDQNTEIQSQIRDQGKKDVAYADTTRDYLTDRYKGYAATGGIDQSEIDKLRATGQAGSSNGGSGGGGGVNTGGAESPYASLKADTYGDEYAGYKGLSETGGVDLTRPQSTYANLQAPGGIDVSGAKTAESDLRNFSATGGVTQRDLDTINRPLFEEFEKTGGYNDKQLADIRGRSNSVIPSFYNNLQDQLDRRRAVQGYSPGFDASTRQLTRQSAQQAADAARDTEMSIGDTVRTGRMDAAKRISDNGMNMLSIATPAKEAAMKDAGNMSLNSADLTSKIQLAAAQGDVDAQKIIQSGKITGLGGMVGSKAQAFADAAQRVGGIQNWDLSNRSIAASSAASAANNALGWANLNAGNERFLINNTLQGREYGDTGMLNTYRSAPGALTQDWNSMQNSINSEGQTQQGLINSNIANAGLPGKYASAFDNITKGLDFGVGAISGLGGMFNKNTGITGGAGDTGGDSSGWA